jgi:hypothetical protein
VATLVDQTTLDEPGHVLVHVAGPLHPEMALGLKPVDRDTHPFTLLAGFTAPPEWTVFGIRVRGRAHQLDDRSQPPVRSVATFLLDRQGQEASVLRSGDDVQDVPGPATGTIPDVCRRVLGLPTPPAPPSTALLWTCTWLDRILDRWGRPERRRELTRSWAQLAVLHPAVQSSQPPDLATLTDPAALVPIARSHAAAHSWEVLRRSPSPLALPEGPLAPDIAAWMDDGFFARWTIGAYPPVDTMARDLRHLLGEPLGPQLLEVLVHLLD